MPFTPPTTVPGADPRKALAALLGLSDIAPEGVEHEGEPAYSPNADLHLPMREGPMSQGDLATPYERSITDRAAAADVRDRARLTHNEDLAQFFSPMDVQQRGEEQKNKIAIARAPAEATAEGNLAIEKLKAQSAENVARIKTENPWGAEGGSNTVDYLAQQALRDPSVITQISDPKLRVAVQSHLAQSGGDLNKLTNQTRQMSEAANDLLPMINNITSQAQQLQKEGLFDIPQSAIRSFLVQHGAGTLMGYGADAAEKAGRFQTDLGLLQSGVARAHAGARGAGNSDMAARFERLMNASGDLPTFLGELQGVRDLLSIYAAHTGPAGVGADPYANPDYQPK